MFLWRFSTKRTTVFCQKRGCHNLYIEKNENEKRKQQKQYKMLIIMRNVNRLYIWWNVHPIFSPCWIGCNVRRDLFGQTRSSILVILTNILWLSSYVGCFAFLPRLQKRMLVIGGLTELDIVLCLTRVL